MSLQDLCHFGNVLASEIFVPKEFGDCIMYSNLILSSDPDFSYNFMGGFVISLLYFSFPFSITKTSSAFSILSRSIPYLKKPQSSL